MFGYRYDTDTGYYYLQSRYYNPEWGRFINADGIIGQTGELLGHNLFAYCKNNPVNMSDESGFRPIYTIGEETDEMMEASVAVVATAARNNASNSRINSDGNISQKSKIIKSVKNAAIDAVPGLFSGTLYSMSENLGEKAVIGYISTKLFGSAWKLPVHLGILESSFKELGIIGLAMSVKDNMKYGVGLGLTRSAIDVAGFIGTAALVSAFAASGGLAAVGIGLGVEVVKWAVTVGVKGFD